MNIPVQILAIKPDDEGLCVTVRVAPEHRDEVQPGDHISLGIFRPTRDTYYGGLVSPDVMAFVVGDQVLDPADVKVIAAGNDAWYPVKATRPDIFGGAGGMCPPSTAPGATS